MNTQDLLTVILLLVIFVSFFLIVAYSLKLKHKQKMEMIKSGDMIFQNTSLRENMKYSSLTQGILLVAVSLGLIISFFVASGRSTQQQFIIYIAICCLTSGIGSLTLYFITRKRD